MTRRRAATLCALLLVIGVVASLAYLWKPLRLSLYVLPGARKELVTDDFRHYEPTPRVTELIALWKDGNPALAELLLDDDPRVWIETAELLEIYFSGARHFSTDWKQLRQFRRWLVSLGQEYAIRFHLLTTVHSFGWRDNYFAPGDGEAHFGGNSWRFYWTAQDGHYPRADAATCDFLHEVARNWSRTFSEVLHEPLELRLRAVDALVAVWAGQSQRERTSVNNLLIDLLEPPLDPEVRLRVASRVLEVHFDDPGGKYPTLDDWEHWVLIKESEPPFGLLEEEDVSETIVLNPAIPEHEIWETSLYAFLALLLIDHPRIEAVLRELRRVDGIADILRELQNLSVPPILEAPESP